MSERTAKVSLGFIDSNPSQKGVFGDNVIAEMTEHSDDFPTPDISIATLTTVNDALKLKTQQALSGDKVKIQERDAAEKNWNDTFRKQAEYVQRIASGSKLIIAKSGFHATDTEVHPVAVPAQAEIQAWGNKGKGSGIHVEMKPLADCRGFIFILSTAPTANLIKVKGDQIKLGGNAQIVELKVTTKRKIDFQDLPSGQTYYVSALGFNATGVGETANPVEVVAP